MKKTFSPIISKSKKVLLFPIRIPVYGFLILLLIIFSSEYLLSRTNPAFFIHLFNVSVPKSAPQASETSKLLDDLRKLINLPADEVPTIATITDIEKIKDQPFFKNAANGDKVIIYATNHKAILYRPSEKKIIDFGPINITNPSVSTPSATPSP